MNHVRWATPSPVPRTTICWLSPRSADQPTRRLTAPAPRISHHSGIFWLLARVSALAWVPVDGVLGSRWLSGLTVLAATLLVAELCVRYSGLYGLIVNLPGLAVIWAAVHGIIQAGRDRRSEHTHRG